MIEQTKYGLAMMEGITHIINDTWQRLNKKTQAGNDGRQKSFPGNSLAMMEGAKLGLAMIEGSPGWQWWKK